jgi:predicted amidohydrolase YtcJ
VTDPVDPTFDPLRDRLFRASRIHTLDPDLGTVAALAVRGGRILAAGSHDEVRARVGPHAETIDLGDVTVTPGFHDAHVHLGMHAIERSQVDLSATTSFAEAIDALRAQADVTPPGAWLQGAGFALQRWGERHPDRAALDAAVPDHPVLLRSQDHHAGLVNGVALERAGVRASTPDPDGGVIVRRADGTPTGLLLERAVGLVADAVPRPDPATLRAVLEDGARSLAALGITTVHHMAYEPPENARAIGLAASDEAFPLRVWACLMEEEIETARRLGLATGQGGGRYQLGGAKFFVDGALGSLTAWMLEPYLGGDDRGIVLTAPERLTERVAAAIDAGLTPVTHAIGDAAVRAVTDAYEATAPGWRAAGLLPRVEHAQHVPPDDAARLARLGVVVSMQPLHLTFDAPTIHERLSDREGRAYPVRSLADGGAILAFGSDTPVAPADVAGSLRAAVDRTGLQGLRVGPSEAIDAAAAVAAYTLGAARAIGRQGRSGVLRPGADADLAAWSHDPTVAVPDGFAARATVLAGRLTYRA